MKFLFAKSRVLLHVAVLVFFLALAVVFFWPFLAGKLSFIWDTREFGFINLNIVTRSLSEGYFPLWNENNFGGYPFAGDIESGMFYPINWLFAWIFGAIDFSELVYYFVFHFFLGAVFAYVLAYKLTKNIFASALAGVIYAYSGYALGHISHLGQMIMYMWVPLVFWAYIKLFEEVVENVKSGSKVKKFFTFLAGLIFGVAILVGHYNTSIYVLLGLVVLTIYEIVGVWLSELGKRLSKWRKINLAINIGRASLFATVFAFMVAAVSVLPVRGLALQSNRAELNYEQQTQGWSLNPFNLIGLFNPDYNHVLSDEPYGKDPEKKFNGSVDITQNYFYIGLIPLVFLIWGILVRNRYKWFCFLFGLIALLAAFGKYTPVNKLLFYYFPGFDKARMAVQIMGMCFLAASMIMAMGAKDLAEKFVGFVGGIKISAFAPITKVAGMIRKGILIFLTAIILFAVPFQIFYHGFDKRFYSERISPEKVFDLPQELQLVDYLKKYSWPKKFLENSDDQLDLMTSLFRIVDEENQLMQNKWEYYGLENVWGNGGIKIKKYNDLFQRKDRTEWQIINDKLYDFLNVRFIFTKRKLSQAHFKKISFGGYNFYVNLGVLPRAFWVEKYQIVADEFDQLERLRKGKVNFAKEVMLNEKPIFYGAETGRRENLSDKSFVNLPERDFDYLKLGVSNHKDAILVLSEVDYDGWRLFVDEVEENIVTANYVFRAVPLMAGEHVIEFKYQPAGVQWGFLISGFAVFVFIISAVVTKCYD